MTGTFKGSSGIKSAVFESQVIESDERHDGISSHSIRHEYPNIIFLLADDLGYGDVGYNGGRAITPNLDDMAKSPHSIRFDRFYSSAPVCSPTRGSLLTGRNHNRFCVWRANTAGKNKDYRADFLAPAKYPLPHSEITLAEILKEHEYTTAVFGKWHLGNLISSNVSTEEAYKGSSNPTDNGFDIWKVTERSAPTARPNCACFDTTQCILGHYYKRGPPPCTNYHGPALRNGMGPSQTLKAQPTVITKDDSEFLADEFSVFLEKVMVNENERKPFFAYLPFHSVHNRYVSVPPYDGLYDNLTLSRQELDYYASISGLDAAVGRIRSLLKRHNISQNTILWFSSDNGPSARSPGKTAGLKGYKGTLHEGGIRVPGIIEWPAVITDNRISNHPVVTSDFFPTVLDSLGLNESLPTGHVLDGISLLPLLQNRTERGSTGREVRSSKSTIKWAFNVNGNFNNKYTAVVLDNSFKLVANYNRGIVMDYSLFDLNRDFQEKKDVSSEHPALCETLLNALAEWIGSVQSSARHESQCLLSK